MKTETETKFIGRVAHNHRVGWVVIWNDDYKSAMPDEATALKCAAASDLLAACEAALQSAERGELVVREFRQSAIFPPNMGPSIVSQSGTDQMKLELKSAISKAKGQ